jgi:hypothetical protein
MRVSQKTHDFNRGMNGVNHILVNRPFQFWVENVSRPLDGESLSGFVEANEP